MADDKNLVLANPQRTLQGMGKEIGTVGLNISNGVVVEEAHTALQWPACLDTYARMGYDPAISSANNTIRAFARKAKYNVRVKSEEPTAQQKEMIKLVESLMDDMDVPFQDVINEALSVLQYGFSIHEKVFKYRNQKGTHGSKHNDGRIGWAKLPIRSQDSIYRWHFDEKGRELQFVEQNMQMVMHNYTTDGKGDAAPFGDGKIMIPRKKFLHFRHNTLRNNPEGTSPMKACYIPWMYKSKIEEFQAIGISRDLGGLPIITLPPEFMSDDASADKKEFVAYCKDIINNLHANEQAGLIFPKFIDENGNDLFEFRLESVQGGKLYDTANIINGYENKILMTYLADVLKLGQDASGSFALSDNKTNLLAVGIHALIKELLEQFNRDLIPQTLLLNGYKAEEGDLPFIEVEELDEPNIAEIAKAAQQFAAAGVIEADETLSEWGRKLLGAPMPDRNRPIKENMIAGGQSKSGEGLKTSGDGTAKNPSAINTTASNTSNK